MAAPREARALARAPGDDRATPPGAGPRALITDMDQPLAPALGNALEIAETMAVLDGAAGPLHALTVALGGGLLALAGLAPDAEDGERRVAEALASGAARERFGAMVAAQGGPADFIRTWRERLPAAPVVRELRAETEGTLQSIDGRGLGMAVVRLGGGRLREGAPIDPSVGLSDVARLGAMVTGDTILARVHAADEASAEAAFHAIRSAFRVGEGAVPPPPLIHTRVDG